ncbi:MAG TPA: ATP-binding cassette domain-containing protein [Candidatus Dormibacteraeota bacterium]
MSSVDPRLEGGPLVAVRGLACGHRLGRPGELIALRDVDLELAPGDLVGLVGAGKTSLLRVLAGLDVPAAGQAVVDGLDLASATARERDQHRLRTVGLVMERPESGLWTTLTAAENVQAPMLVAGVGRAQRLERAAELLEAVRLTGRAQHRPQALAGGDRLRLAIAVALANRPPLLLVDDPASELDRDTARTVLFDLESLLRRSGTAALIAGGGPDVEPYVDRLHRLGAAASPAPLPLPAPVPDAPPVRPPTALPALPAASPPVPEVRRRA